jgi:cysteinyl-tRNA synthetase
MQSHYRKSLVFSYENLDNAVIAYNKLVARIVPLLREEKNGDVDADALAALKKKFTDALDNDLNTSLAVTALYDVLKAKCNAATKLAAISDFDTVLCLDLLAAAQRVIDEEEKARAEKEAALAADPVARAIEEKIAARAAAKKAKNFAEADRIRDELAAEGIILVDTAAGTTWKKAE